MCHNIKARVNEYLAQQIAEEVHYKKAVVHQPQTTERIVKQHKINRLCLRFFVSN